MTKIVYNACFGGFGLSDEAVMRYAEIKGINLVQVKEKDSYSLWYVDGIKDNEHYFSDRDIERNDPALVQVVEELGDKASDRYAELRIYELEPGTRYRIDEYDGSERVMTIEDYEWSTA
jgi:hypothetical protein